MKYQVCQYVPFIQYIMFLYTKFPVYTKFGHMTYLLLSCTPKPILLILQLILVSVVSSHDTSFIKSVILSPSFLSLSLKISYISKSLIRGIVLFCLIQYLLLFMPPIRSTASRRYNKLILLILSISKVMPSCSCYIKKGLLYIIIASPSSRQLLSCAEYTTVNMHLFYNVCLVSNTEYKYLITYLNYCVSYLICLRVLDLIHC